MLEQPHEYHVFKPCRRIILFSERTSTPHDQLLLAYSNHQLQLATATYNRQLQPRRRDSYKVAASQEPPLRWLSRSHGPHALATPPSQPVLRPRPPGHNLLSAQGAEDPLNTKRQTKQEKTATEHTTKTTKNHQKRGRAGGHRKNTGRNCRRKH